MANKRFRRIYLFFGLSFALLSLAALAAPQAKVLTFNDDYVEIADSDALDLTGGSFTISMWIKPVGWGENAQGRILDHGGGSNGGTGWSLHLENKSSRGLPQALRFQINNDSSYDDMSNPGVIALDVWQHAAVTYESGTLTFYVNAIEVGTSSNVPSPLARDEILRIGARAAEENRFFDGGIDEVRIWDRALGNQEILDRMDQELTGSEPGLVAYYTFNEGSGQTAVDAAGNGHGGQLGSTSTVDDEDPQWTTNINQAPQVDAGSDFAVILSAGPASLGGSASDDGLPTTTFFTNWTVVSAPDVVNFSDATDPAGTVTFGSPGTYVLRLTADDTVLNSSDDVTIQVDLTAELVDIAITPNPVNLLTGNTQLFTAQGIDQTGAPIAATPAWSATGGFIDPQSGLYTAGGSTGPFSVTASDGAVAGFADVFIIEDMAPPTVSLTVPRESGWVSGTIGVTASVADDVAISGIEVLINGSSIGTDDFPPYRVDWATRSISNGVYNVTVVATDTSGNQSNDSVTVTVDNATDLQNIPVPFSTVITGLEWADPDTLTRSAEGSDGWQITWADDGNQYTAYGDGLGFNQEAPRKLSLGFAKIAGPADNYQATNIPSPTGEQLTGGGTSGKKSTGMLMVDGIIYLFVRNADQNGHECQLLISDDHMQTWTWMWKIPELGYCALLNFGQNYAGARDNYVYLYSPNINTGQKETDEVVMARVPKDQITNRNAYEFLSGFNGQGDPQWSSDIDDRVPTFVFPGGANRLDVTYNAAIGRYLMVDRSRAGNGGLNQFSIFDAPEPWGPWTTVFYTENYFGEPLTGGHGGWDESQHIPSKWIAPDGKSFFLICACFDTFGVIEAFLTLEAENLAPLVGAGTDQQIILPTDTVNLAGSANDDGLPDGNLTTDWSQVSGPGTVTFGDSTALITTAQFSTDGVYVLQLLADDGDLTVTDRVTITIFPEPDLTDPTVTMSSPAAGMVAGLVTVSATADDNIAVASVVFSVDSTVIATDTTEPFSVAWDSTSVVNGVYSISAQAIDTSGNTATDTVAVTVTNNQAPGAPPLVSPGDSVVIPTTELFDWDMSTDPENDSFTYTLEISTDSNFATVDFRVEEIPVSYYFVDASAGLLDGATYYWRVTAVDEFGNQDTSPVRSFDTDNASILVGGVLISVSGTALDPVALGIEGVVTAFEAGTANVVSPVAGSEVYQQETATFYAKYPVDGTGYDFSVSGVTGYETGMTAAPVPITQTSLPATSVILPIDDRDGDGLTNDDEVNIFLTDPDNPDTDGDGLSDFDEVNRDGDPDSYSAGADTDPLDTDSDNDGLLDGGEEQFGTDPLDASDNLLPSPIRVSTDNDGIEGTGTSSFPVLSTDGRYVAFHSDASNLVAGDNNVRSDVFIKDTQTGVTTRVSTDSNGLESDGNSFDPVFSDDGRYVAFSSAASNLVAGDTNGVDDVFHKDTQTGATTRVSTDSDGLEGAGASSFPALSANARYVAFSSAASNLVAGDSNGASDVFIKDTQTGATTRVSTDSLGRESDNNSSSPVLSADGRYVAFSSAASNLVAGDTNLLSDVFIKDRQTSVTTRVSTDSLGVEGNSNSSSPILSTDGRYVAFSSGASNLVTGDSNGFEDVFIKDRQTVVTMRVTTGNSGLEGTGDSSFPAISTDGHYMAFTSLASNLVDEDTNGVLDAFRAESPAYRQDTDGDGAFDALDNCPSDSNSTQDDGDIDGVGDVCDAFPSDTTESIDTDLDGIGNNADPDDDNDRINDGTEIANGTNPLNADTDGDGVDDKNDTFPLDPTSFELNLNGTIKTTAGVDICAMVLVSGQFMFSCNPDGIYSFTDLPVRADGSAKLQVYAQGFQPYISNIIGSQTLDIVMTAAGACPNYNDPVTPGVFPESAGQRIDISGSVEVGQNGNPVCAMVLANGQFMFSCDGTGSYALNVPLNANGQVKLQIYASGFAPYIIDIDEFQSVNIAKLARASECSAP